MSSRKRNLIFAASLIVLGAAFVLIYLALLGNTNQVYEDIVAEFTAIKSSNKSIERSLVYILVAIGVLACTVYYFFTYKKETAQDGLLSGQSTKEIVVLLASLLVANYFIYGEAHELLIIALIYMAVVALVNRELVLTGAAVYFLGVYAYIALYRLYVYFGGMGPGNLMTGALFSLFISAVPLLFPEKKKPMLRLFMIEGMFVPFTLLVYLSNLYLQNGEYITIDVPAAVKILIAVLIIIFLLEAVIKLTRNWKDADELGRLVNIGSCIAIIAFNRYEGTGAIMSTDTHHPFENIIGFSQIFELGQSPFTEYIPISGMYSVFHGAIFALFGDGGLFSNYYVATNVYYLIPIILVVLLMKTQLDGRLMFFISLFWQVGTYVGLGGYDRVIFILPTMLLLISPRLIEKRNAWLMSWFLTSLFLGLYYPLYGAAVALSMLPMGVYQIVGFVKDGELKKSVHTVKFWLGWIICLAITVFCIPLLLGTLRHMLAMSGQSVLADGIARFGQLVDEDFFPYLLTNYPVVRLALYLVFTFLLPAVVVCLAYMLSIRLGAVRYTNRRLKITNFQQFALFLSISIMLSVSYTYTLIRLDIDTILARSGPVLAGVMVIFVVLVLRYVDDGVSRLILLAFTAFILTVDSKVSIYSIDDGSKLEAYYTVGDNYLYVKDDVVEKFGEGFVNQDTYDAIESAYIRFTDKDKNASYFGDVGSFGYFYLLETKGDGTVEIGETKSYEAAQEAVDLLRENDSIVGTFSSYYNYYLYDYIMTSGEYYWNAQAYDYWPNNGQYTKEEVLAINRACHISGAGMWLNNVASSWGLSMDTLEPIMDKVDIVDGISSDGTTATVDFTGSISGVEADFLYLEFDGMDENFQYVLFDSLDEYPQAADGLCKYFMKKDYNRGMTVQVSWQDEAGETYYTDCRMGQGKLLIPLGAGSGWLLENHDSLTIKVFQDDVQIATPEITEARMYLIRDVK